MADRRRVKLSTKQKCLIHSRDFITVIDGVALALAGLALSLHATFFCHFHISILILTVT